MKTDYLDHSVTITRDYDTVFRRYEQLGFTLSPMSRHKVSVAEGEPLTDSCTGNRCAYFGKSYIEIIGIVEPDGPDPWHAKGLIDGKYQGVRGLSVGMGGSEDALRRLRAAGLESGAGITELQRPVETGDGMHMMHARSVHLDPAKTPEGILHSAEHLTPEIVHQPRYCRHVNGATHLDAVLLVVADDELDSYVDRYAAMLSQSAVDEGPVKVFALSVGRVEIIPAGALADILPHATVPMVPFFAGHAVSVPDLDIVRKLAAENYVVVHEVPGGVAVDVDATGLIFRTPR
jgi:hypothetical protein